MLTYTLALQRQKPISPLFHGPTWVANAPHLWSLLDVPIVIFFLFLQQFHPLLGLFDLIHSFLSFLQFHALLFLGRTETVCHQPVIDLLGVCVRLAVVMFCEMIEIFQSLQIVYESPVVAHIIYNLQILSYLLSCSIFVNQLSHKVM